MGSGCSRLPSHDLRDERLVLQCVGVFAPRGRGRWRGDPVRASAALTEDSGKACACRTIKAPSLGTWSKLALNPNWPPGSSLQGPVRGSIVSAHLLRGLADFPCPSVERTAPAMPYQGTCEEEASRQSVASPSGAAGARVVARDSHARRRAEVAAKH
ncbi:hypothetical protein MTO96_001024 [Rhipicephalus appendiculatus]